MSLRRVRRNRLRSIYKSPYLLYPLVILAIILIYAEMFLLLEGEFNVRHGDFFTALYWVIITMTTVGYGDIYPVTFLGKLFSIIVILTGIVILFAIVFPLMITPLIDQLLKTPTRRLPDWMRSHVIICGYNALVDTLIYELAETDRPFLVIDESTEAVRALQSKGYYAIRGDPSDEDVLKSARIEDADTLISNAGDAKNAAIVITASQISECKVIALVENLDVSHYLEYAGADVVVSPKQILGANIGLTAISSVNFEATNVIDLGENIKMCKLPIYPDNPIVGRHIADIGIKDATGASVVAVFDHGRFVLDPPHDYVINESTVIVVTGTDEQLKKISTLAPIRNPACCGISIIAGFGDVGKEVARRFDEKGIAYTIIDIREYPEKNQVIGDSSDIEVLKKAGVESSSTIIVTLNDDDKNMLTTLLARNLNPHINIICRANLDRSVPKLYRAGADYVTSLSTIGGQILAKIVEKGIFEEASLLSENLLLSRFEVKRSDLEGISIKDSAIQPRTGCTIMGILEKGQFHPVPDPSTILTPDSVIVTVGTPKQLETCSSMYGLRKIQD